MTTNTDLRIPSKAAILAASADYRESAERIGDTAALRQIDRLMDNVDRGAVLSWQLGILHVGSPSGHEYHVSRAGCDCVNGQKGKAQCWHWALRNLLEDMLEQAALEGDDDVSDLPDPVATFERRLAETAAILDLMRAEQKQSRVETEVARPMGVRLAQARAIIADLYEWVD